MCALQFQTRNRSGYREALNEAVVDGKVSLNENKKAKEVQESDFSVCLMTNDVLWVVVVLMCWCVVDVVVVVDVAAAVCFRCQPALPYLGCHLADLTFMFDGNPDEVDDLINFQKRSMISNQVKTTEKTPVVFVVSKRFNQ